MEQKHTFFRSWLVNKKKDMSSGRKKIQSNSSDVLSALARKTCCKRLKCTESLQDEKSEFYELCKVEVDAQIARRPAAKKQHLFDIQKRMDVFRGLANSSVNEKLKIGTKTVCSQFYLNFLHQSGGTVRKSMKHMAGTKRPADAMLELAEPHRRVKLKPKADAFHDYVQGASDAIGLQMPNEATEGRVTLPFNRKQALFDGFKDATGIEISKQHMYKLLKVDFKTLRFHKPQGGHLMCTQCANYLELSVCAVLLWFWIASGAAAAAEWLQWRQSGFGSNWQAASCRAPDLREASLGADCVSSQLGHGDHPRLSDGQAEVG